MVDASKNKGPLFNCETHKETILMNPDEIYKFTCFIPIRNDKIFCCATKNSQDLNIASIVNVRKSSWTEITSENISVCWNRGGIYYKNQIYLFGGQNNNWYLKDSDKYDLKLDMWTKLAPLPLNTNLCNCIFFNLKILISGKMKQVYSYDIITDSYSKILKISSYGIVATLNKRAYLFETFEYIYESQIGDEYNWKKLGKNSLNGNLLWKFYYNGSFYIKTCESNSDFYYKFDLENKTLNKISRF